MSFREFCNPDNRLKKYIYLFSLTPEQLLRGLNAHFGVCNLAGLPLVRTLSLDALVGWLEVHGVVAVGEEQSLIR